MIPNPLIRYAVVTVATALVPVVVERLAERWHGRKATAPGRRLVGT
jgi:hypothetical protein